MEKKAPSVQAGEIVSRDDDIHNGGLVFASTRVPVDTLVAYLEAGHSVGSPRHTVAACRRNGQHPRKNDAILLESREIAPLKLENGGAFLYKLYMILPADRRLN